MIKMLTSVSGNGFTIDYGQTTDKFSKAEEDRFVEKGLAERVEKPKVKNVSNAKRS